MQKIPFILVFNLITVNLFAMQRPEFHYLMQRRGYSNINLITDSRDRLDGTFSNYEYIGPWEDSLAEEFKRVTPQAMLHFHAIKKIMDCTDKKACTTKTPQPGLPQTVRGLRLYYTWVGCFLATPWGSFAFYGDCHWKQIMQNLRKLISLKLISIG